MGGLLESGRRMLSASAGREEAVLEAVVGWMKARQLLVVDVHQLLPVDQVDWIDGPVLENFSI